MQTYMSMIQNSWGVAVIYGAAGIVLCCFMLCLSIRARYRNKLSRLSGELAQTQIAYEQLKSVREELQQLQEDLQYSNAKIEQHGQQVSTLLGTITKELALNSDQVITLDNVDVWQRQEMVVNFLINHLHQQQSTRQDLEMQLEALNGALAEQQSVHAEMENILANLKVKNCSYKAYIGKLELNRMKVFNDLNLSAQKIRQLTALLNEVEQTNHDDDAQHFQEKERAYKIQINKLELARMKVFNDLNLAVHKIRELEAGLQTKTVPVVEVAPSVVVETPISAQYEALPVAESTDYDLPKMPKQPQQLFTKLINSVKTDFNFGKKSVLQADDNAVQQAVVEDDSAVIEKRGGDVAGIPELENQLLAGDRIRPDKFVEKIALAMSEGKPQWFNPFKKKIQQIEDLPQEVAKGQTDADEIAKQIPGQLKSMYQKIISFTAH